LSATLSAIDEELIARVPDTQAADAERTRRAISQRLRRCRLHNVVDQTGAEPGEVAIYCLSDPRDIETARYIGQTRSPPSRFTQHINAARLWLPDAAPWWVKREAMRPLYTWIRALHADGQRLPMMIVLGWTTAELANSDERRFIRAFLADKLPLLNHVSGMLLPEVRSGQLPH
jgi:hypothetical protein